MNFRAPHLKMTITLQRRTGNDLHSCTVVAAILQCLCYGGEYVLGSTKKKIAKAVRGLKPKRQGERSLARIIWGWLFFIFMLVLVCFIGVYTAGHRTRVEGNAMYPTLADGDSILIDQISYRFFKPVRYDVVVFPSRFAENTYYIKRVIALPGETVQITDGTVYVNGEALKERFPFDPIENGGLAQTPVTLGEDEYFVLGDNRNSSSDSREPIIGNIRGEDMIGKALLRVTPLTKFGLVR